jgi:hypothetical protein
MTLKMDSRRRLSLIGPQIGRLRQFRKALQAQALPDCKASSCMNKPTLRSLAR